MKINDTYKLHLYSIRDISAGTTFKFDDVWYSKVSLPARLSVDRVYNICLAVNLKSGSVIEFEDNEGGDLLVIEGTFTPDS